MLYNKHSTTGDTELGVNGEHQNLVHETSSVTSRKQIEPSTRGWIRCGRCNVLWYEIGFYLCTLLFVLFLGLFIYEVSTNTHSQACRLTYTDDATISEAEMQSWASQNDWGLSTPRYDAHFGMCVCSAAYTNPNRLQSDSEVPVWIAPGDIVSLYRDELVTQLPVGFATQYVYTYGEHDHVKMCLTQTQLIHLWGDDYESRHCHHLNSETSKMESIYVGFDGALYCAYCVSCPNYDG